MMHLHCFALKQTTTWRARCNSVISCYMNRTKHRGTCCPPYFYHCEVNTYKQKHEVLCKKKTKKQKKSLFPWSGYGVLQGTRNKVPSSKKQCSTINPTPKLNRILNMM
jgi:hypothetical protein